MFFYLSQRLLRLAATDDAPSIRHMPVRKFAFLFLLTKTMTSAWQNTRGPQRFAERQS